MKCPVCEKEGLKSNVYPGMATSTLMNYQPHYDEEGKYHSNDPNTFTTDYSCSNGHQWREKRRMNETTIEVLPA